MDACAGVGFRRDLGGRRMPRRVIRRDLDIPRGAARERDERRVRAGGPIGEARDRNGVSAAGWR